MSESNTIKLAYARYTFLVFLISLLMSLVLSFTRIDTNETATSELEKEHETHSNEDTILEEDEDEAADGSSSGTEKKPEPPATSDSFKSPSTPQVTLCVKPDLFSPFPFWSIYIDKSSSAFQAIPLGFTILGEIFAYVTVIQSNHWGGLIPSLWMVHARCVFVASICLSRTWMHMRTD